MKLSANRVVLFFHGALTVVTIVGLYLAAVQGSLPSKWQETAGVVAGIVTALGLGTAGVLKFLDGSQKSEALNAQKPAPVVPAVPVAVIPEPDTLADDQELAGGPSDEETV